MSLPESRRRRGKEDDLPPFIEGTPEERARIARRGSFVLRSCLVVVIATMIFEGVVLGGTRFGWIGAIVGPFAIYLGGVVLGLLGFMALLTVAHVADRGRDRPEKRGRGASPPHPLADDQLDRPAP
jgi:hypothetical protein